VIVAGDIGYIAYIDLIKNCFLLNNVHFVWVGDVNAEMNI